MVEAVHEKTVAKGCYVIREGELGNHFYVSAEGEYEVIKDGKVLGRLGVGKAFGELAILYNCKRTASIKVTMTDIILTARAEIHHLSPDLSLCVTISPFQTINN